MIKEKVSICVITYNSSKTVIETLDSILNQRYGTNNLELIIADDGSQDNTIDIINCWLKKFKINFYVVKFIKHKKNRGISYNINSAWKLAQYEWIKTIAGDDILLDSCIDDYMDYVADKDCQCVFGIMQSFNGIDNNKELFPKNREKEFFTLPAKEQYEYLKRKSFNIAPTSFIRSDLLKKIGYADEKYTLIEDLPVWLKITSNNIKLDFIDKCTVFYRISNSITKSETRFINLEFIHQIEEINKEYIWPTYKYKDYWRIVDSKINVLSWRITVSIFGNKNRIRSKVFRSFILIFRPRTYVKILRRIC
ncbi:glycosyltransferase family 2 protein [Photobacterium carnosum]|uniref:glycosyltransferase family 2 protein n=1 Tax=Photobacterium carnosum TaxID=2023717 RepID=UPI00128E6068|nr:glycosyltransferase [Photobacterium carnosum]KAE8177960.1 hypothetical protein CIT27_04255 [Photobacterium carnosum]